MSNLSAKYDLIENRLAILESYILFNNRYDTIFAGIAKIEASFSDNALDDQGKTVMKIEKETKSFQATPGASETQHLLEKELFEKSITDFRFVRAPADYYEQSLEFRKGIVGCDSIHQLCKSMIMENTKAHPSVDGWSNPYNSKYYVVIVQYSARLHGEKLKTAVAKLNNGVSRQYFNLRLAPEDVSDELSGFTHNAVTPIGIRSKLPIILSHKISALRSEPPEDISQSLDYFWLGGGEVDLKLGMRISDFISNYNPIIMDCTY